MTNPEMPGQIQRINEGEGISGQQESGDRQIAADRLMEELPNLDFKSGAAVTDWLGRLEKLGDEVNVPYEEIVATFKENGIEARVSGNDNEENLAA